MDNNNNNDNNIPQIYDNNYYEYMNDAYSTRYDRYDNRYNNYNFDRMYDRSYDRDYYGDYDRRMRYYQYPYCDRYGRCENPIWWMFWPLFFL